MEKHTTVRRPFITTNEPLAVALCALGAPWFTDSDGEVIPCYNVYTPDILRGIDAARRAAGKPSLRLAEKPADEAVRTACRAREKGKVEYWFDPSEVQAQVVDGWAKRSASIEAADRGEAGGQSAAEVLAFAPKDAAKLLCQFFKTGQDFRGTDKRPPLWMAKWPQLDESRVSSHGEPQSERGATIRGSLKRRSIKV